MRSMLACVVIAAIAAVTGCGGEGSGNGSCAYKGRAYDIGEQFPAGDGCNACECLGIAGMPEVICSEVPCSDGGTDANPMSCAPSDGCLEGPACDGRCCGFGERCVNGTCTCGGKPACTGTDRCERAGPIGGDMCGTLCCGFTTPCPQ